MIPVSAPPRLRSHLAGAPDGHVRVLHRGVQAVYLEVSGRCVGVVTARATRVPCALRSDRDRLGPVHAAHIEAGVLHLDGEPLVIGRLVDVRVPPLPSVVEVPRGTSGLETTATSDDLGTDDVAQLIGAGDGLTPYGDDVLCGWLAVHRAAGVPTPQVDAAVRALAHRTTLLSATLLDCAMHGEVIPEFGAYVAAIGTAQEALRAAELAAIGHTSGAGLLQGARRALAGFEARFARTSTTVRTA